MSGDTRHVRQQVHKVQLLAQYVFIVASSGDKSAILVTSYLDFFLFGAGGSISSMENLESELDPPFIGFSHREQGVGA